MNEHICKVCGSVMEPLFTSFYCRGCSPLPPPNKEMAKIFQAQPMVRGVPIDPQEGKWEQIGRLSSFEVNKDTGDFKLFFNNQPDPIFYYYITRNHLHRFTEIDFTKQSMTAYIGMYFWILRHDNRKNVVYRFVQEWSEPFTLNERESETLCETIKVSEQDGKGRGERANSIIVDDTVASDLEKLCIDAAILYGKEPLWEHILTIRDIDVADAMCDHKQLDAQYAVGGYTRDKHHSIVVMVDPKKLYIGNAALETINPRNVYNLIMNHPAYEGKVPHEKYNLYYNAQEDYYVTMYPGFHWDEDKYAWMLGDQVYCQSLKEKRHD